MHNNHTHHDTVQKPPLKLGDFVPLIIIFVLIFFFTAGMQVRLGFWDGMVAMQHFMGAFFIVFGSFKLINWKGFVNAYTIYDIIAKRSRLYGYLYPLIELSLGISYLLAFNLLITSWITLVIMIISSIGVANELRKKNVIPCACLGVVFKIPMTKVTLFEDLLMAFMALWMILNIS